MQKKYKFSANDVSIMMLLFRQLLDAMDRIEAHNQIKSINKELQFANERLKNQAVRDNLTGLYYVYRTCTLALIYRAGG